MQFTTVSDIITKRVLNEYTGELESTSFKQIKKTKKIRGGFHMVYKSYDESLLQIIKSNKDLELLIYIRDMFTKTKSERELSASAIGIAHGTTRQKVFGLINRMTNAKLLFKVGKMSYRLNPFMYIPYQADGSLLQEEWTALVA